MKGLLTFPAGGVHPPEGKELSSDIPVKVFKKITQYTVPLSQHLGSPANPVVEAGTAVTRGQLIGESSGFISANIHTPVSGTVKEIIDIQLATGQISRAVVIEAGDDEETDYAELRNWEELTAEELIARIKHSGIVGMGGAAFPAHVKVSIPKGYTAEYLVINGVECEPYLTSDHRLMLEENDRIFLGIRILKKILNVSKIYIGIENNKPDAIEVMRNKAAEVDSDITVFPLKVKYPQGDEKQLLKAVIGKEVPSGKLPIEIGAVVVNVSTAASICDAVAYGKPLFERNVSVTGGAIKHPGNYRIRVGTPIREVLEECGGFKETPAKIIVGGPMMGFPLLDLDTPVTKGTSGILVLSSREAKTGILTNCISCGRCVSVCPMGLNPSKLFKYIDHQEFQVAADNGLMDCKECGCCNYTCPANISLVNGFKAGKFELRRIQNRKK